MNMASLLPGRWRLKREAGRHNAAIIDVLMTAPISPKADGLVLFSMIGSTQVLPFLVAVKSLWSHLQRGRVAILDDGTLTAQDRTILAQHCGDPQIMRQGDVVRGPFPGGGGWARLLTILDHRAGEYWLQLDSDTVTLGALPEVEAAMSSNRSFTLMDSADAADHPMELGAYARQSATGTAHDDDRTGIERRMAGLAPDKGWKYLRGNAGFAGFAAGNAGRDLATAFLGQMQALIGEDDAAHWTMQHIASSFIIANEGAPACLPWPRYINYTGTPWPQDCCFVHFTGAQRHENGAYLAASRAAIAAIDRR
ncbi:hypothetical protein GCM10009127_06780 [Alteraurantiacibacter aestuarii]|uniref:Uncharacterized protein n=1 Tax=Alteraurantiacibacter aestuarii TaxID=650004 RepID=A0A844ZMT5_9SPHN|nr:hypothetical protein [Alteraurantiacibacter aestuarii]MXO89155.1 hypothetical protein [Alteraurantiacibacter aestuarii]